MTTPSRPEVLVVGVGGLGAALVHEALSRDLNVSVLVRNPAKLLTTLGEEAANKLHTVHVGDCAEQQQLERALELRPLVLSGIGANPPAARSLAQAGATFGIPKIVWPAGTTNVLAEDGVTPNYKTLLEYGAWVEEAYHTHAECIDAISNSGVNYVIFCPGQMDTRGAVSHGVESTIRVNRDAGPFVSYEDAAWVMVTAALGSQYDRQLISAATGDNFWHAPGA